MPPASRDGCHAIGLRSITFAPMLMEGRAIGSLWVGRTFTGPFGEKQIALLRTFAEQAVIAIQNARLFNETKEALDRQTATAEVLRVISESPTDVQPVLDAVAQRALRLCDAAQSVIGLVEGDNIRFVAEYGSTSTAIGEVVPLARGLVIGRAIVDRAVVHVDDLAAESEEEYPQGREMQRRIGHRTTFAVPLMREGEAIGAIAVWRMEVRPFVEKQRELLHTFANQAVIAIENVRLFNETREALDRQTATSEVLRAISESPSDVEPVFRTIADAALRLCHAASAVVATYDGTMLAIGAVASATPRGADAIRALFPRPASGDNGITRAVLTRRRVEIPDVLADPGYKTQELSVESGFRSVVAVPLLRDGQPIGAISLGRPEPGRMPEAQVDLLQAFADQAVIAIENVRLFNETKAALERQTATARILSAMSGSIADTKPVFEAIVASCRALFADSVVALRLLRGGVLEVEANIGMDSGPVPLDSSTAVGTCALERARSTSRTWRCRPRSSRARGRWR